jgi:soluble lytic murein transglycosylase-like protein
MSWLACTKKPHSARVAPESTRLSAAYVAAREAERLESDPSDELEAETNEETGEPIVEQELPTPKLLEGPPSLDVAARAISEGHAEQALLSSRGFGEATQEAPRARAHAIRGLAHSQLGMWAEAVEEFEKLQAIDDWDEMLPGEIIAFELAKARRQYATHGELERAAREEQRKLATTALGKLLSAKNNREAASMRILQARILGEMQGVDDKKAFWAALKAARNLSGIVRDYPNHPEIGLFRLEHARALVRGKKYSEAAEAFEAIAVERAGEPEAELAWRELEALAAEDNRVAAPKWTHRKRLNAAAHARGLRRLERARQLVDEVLEDPDLSSSMRKEAIRSRARTARRQRDWETCIADLRGEWDRTHNLELREEYTRCLERGAHYDELIALWLDGIKNKTSARQEEALFRSSQFAFRAGRYTQARDVIARYEKRWRGHSTERNFMRAMIAQRLGEDAQAIEEFKKLRYRSESRKEMSRYYIAKLQLRSGDEVQRVEGIDTLRKMVGRGYESLTSSGIYGGFPFYYAIQARQRLIEAGVDVDAPPKLTPMQDVRRDFNYEDARQLYVDTLREFPEISVALQRSQQFHSIGEIDRAQRELRIAIDELLGGIARSRGGKLRSPKNEEYEVGAGWRATYRQMKPRISRNGRKLIRSESELARYKGKLRMLAAALDEPHRVAKLSSRSLPYRARYHLEAFPGTIRPNAKRYELDPTHLWALMYTESRFRRHVVSYVGARGALQVMPWTGRQLQERLGEFDGRMNADILFDIEDNGRLASYYVSELMKNFGDQPAFVYASYNGGPSNVARWLEAKAKGPTPLGLDDFIEEIPFTETHRYTKRVLETQAAYALMYGGTLPQWGDAVDAKVQHNIEF